MQYIWDKVISSTITLSIGLCIGAGIRKLRSLLLNRRITKFFRKKNSNMIAIVYSTVFTEAGSVYGIPSCDVGAILYISNFFNCAGLKKGKDYLVLPHTDFINESGKPLRDPKDYNLILICGPKRNSLTGEVLKHDTYSRYTFLQDEQSLEYYLIDRDMEARHTVTRHDQELIKNNEIKGFDFGLIASKVNPYNSDNTLVMVCGIHGAGTLAAAQFISDSKNLKKLLKLKNGGIIERLIKVYYNNSFENITDIKLL